MEKKAPKQVIVVRKDLNMRKGKLAAQAAHASMKVFFDRGSVTSKGDQHWLSIHLTPEMKEWVNGTFTKIVVSVDSCEALLSLKAQAEAIGIPCALIEDCGFTEFHGVKTATALALGPADPDMVNQITGSLPLI